MSSAPWRRAPLLLWRRPGVLASVAGACAVLTAAIAGVPLFLSSVGSAAVAQQVADRCPGATGASRFFEASGARLDERERDPFAALHDRLGPSSRWARQDDLVLAGPDPSRSTRASLLTRDDVLDHVEVIERSGGPGVWISDRARTATGLSAGSIATIGPVDVPVAGVYRDLAGTPVDDYWCSHGDMLILQGPERIPPPPVILADAETFAAVQREQPPAPDVPGLPSVRRSGAWEAPVRDGLTVADADDLVDELACAGSHTAALDWCTSGARDAGPFAPGDDRKFVSDFFETSLPFVADRARAIQTSVGGGVWPVAAFAALGGAGLVAAAASFWFDRRRREVTLLTVRGVSPAGLGVKAVLELLVPIVIGVALGVVCAYLFVERLGPSAEIEIGSVERATLAGAVAAIVAAIIVGGVVAWRARTHDGRRRRVRVGLLPWELALGTLTVLSLRRLGEWGVPVGQGADVSRVDVLGLLFPVLFLLTVVAVFSRMLGLAVRPMRAASRGAPTALYLAISRVARYRLAAIALLAACTVAAGVMAYAATLERSLDATLDAKAAVFVGSDVAVRLASDTALPAELAAHSTLVDVHRYAWVQNGDDRESVVVYGIDPSTFTQGAFWDDSFAGLSFDEVVDRLSEPPDGVRIPAVLVGLDAPGAPDVMEAGIATVVPSRFSIERIAHVDAMPGLKRGLPTMYVDASALAALEGAPPPTTTETWIRGDRDDTLATLDAAGINYAEERRVGDVVDRASFLTVSWTFGFMQSLALAAGILVVGGVAVHVESQRRGRVLGYAFARRMGLRRAQHRCALFVELAASVVVGCTLGIAAALTGVRLVYHHIDPVPGFRPDPLVRPAIVVIAIVFVGSIVLTAIAAAVAQRRTDRDDPAEVLRAGA